MNIDPYRRNILTMTIIELVMFFFAALSMFYTYSETAYDILQPILDRLADLPGIGFIFYNFTFWTMILSPFIICNAAGLIAYSFGKSGLWYCTMFLILILLLDIVLGLICWSGMNSGEAWTELGYTFLLIYVGAPMGLATIADTIALIILMVKRRSIQ